MIYRWVAKDVFGQGTLIIEIIDTADKGERVRFLTAAELKEVITPDEDTQIYFQGNYIEPPVSDEG